MEEDYTVKAQRNLRRIIFAAGGVLVLIVVIVFFIFNGIVFLNVSGDAAGNTIVTAAVSNTATKQIGSSGLLIVPRDTKGLLVTAGDYVKTETGFTVPWFGITGKTVDLQRDKNADKVAYSSSWPICATYDPTGDNLLSYDCQKPTQLLRFDTPKSGAWKIVKQTDLSYIANQTMPAYMGGVLGLTAGAAPQGPNIPENSPFSAYVTATLPSVKHTYLAPSGVEPDSLKGIRLITDTTDPKDSRFVIVDTYGTIYLATPSADGSKVTYKRVAPPDKYSYRYNQTFCSFSGDTVYCFRGRTAVAAPSNTPKVDPTLVKLNFTDGVTQTSGVDGVPILDGFYVTGSGSIYGKTDKTIYALTAANGKYTGKQLIQTADFVTVGQNLYLIAGNGVYQLDDSTLDTHQVFYSPGVTPLGVYPTTDKVFVFGIAKNEENTVSAYQLKADGDTTPGNRLIDVLPLALTQLPGADGNELVGNTLAIHPSDTSGTTKTKLTDSVLGLGLNLSRDNILFTQ